MLKITKTNTYTQYTSRSHLTSLPHGIKLVFRFRFFDFDLHAFCKPWPIIAQFLDSLPTGYIGLDSGTGNGKYLPLPSDRPSGSTWTIGLDRSRNLLNIARTAGGTTREVIWGDVIGNCWRAGAFVCGFQRCLGQRQLIIFAGLRDIHSHYPPSCVARSKVCGCEGDLSSVNFYTSVLKMISACFKASRHPTDEF